MLPNPPRIVLEKLGDNEGEPFLELKRHRYVAHYPDGSQSEPFSHDIVARKKMDAVLMVPYFIQNNALFIYLRSSMRPALADRFVEGGNLWEFPAGLIDDGETPEETAARELMEEVGFEAAPEDMKTLGVPVFTAVGVLAEIIHFFRVRVDPSKQKTPSEDGSPLERGAAVGATCLESLQCMVSRELIRDMKTELAIRRMEKLWHVGAL
jgi:ADP-ribose pyrophosphatase